MRCLLSVYFVHLLQPTLWTICASSASSVRSAATGPTTRATCNATFASATCTTCRRGAARTPPTCTSCASAPTRRSPLRTRRRCALCDSSSSCPSFFECFPSCLLAFFVCLCVFPNLCNLRASCELFEDSASLTASRADAHFRFLNHSV